MSRSDEPLRDEPLRDEPPGQRPPREKPPGLRGAHSLRPTSSVVVGVAGGIAGLSLLVPALLSSERSVPLIASVVLALVLLWLFVARPRAVIHDDGIRLVNPLRVVDVTWPAITEVRSKWALELFVGQTRYTAWGVPADPKRPRHGRGLLTLGANKVATGAGARSGRGSVLPPVEPKVKVEAQTVATEVEDRILADRRRKDGRTPRIAHQSWDPVSVGMLLAAVAFFALALLFG
ncbi:MAG: PH domain-containing protein [Humibacillus sp.]|nr:PH domain-containing protein [Humibacillus sp.]